MPETKFKTGYKFFTQISAGPNSFRIMHIIRNKIPRLIRWVIFDASRHENHQYSSILSLFQRVDCGMFLEMPGTSSAMGSQLSHHTSSHGGRSLEMPRRLGMVQKGRKNEPWRAMRHESQQFRWLMLAKDSVFEGVYTQEPQNFKSAKTEGLLQSKFKQCVKGKFNKCCHCNSIPIDIQYINPFPCNHPTRGIQDLLQVSIDQS
jgi:hypothetical protein